MSTVASYQSILQRLNAMLVAPRPAAARPTVTAPVATTTYPVASSAILGQDRFVRTSGLFAPTAPVTRRPPADPNSYFVTQFYHPVWNPQAPAGTTNCGPASLAMALKAFGLAPAGVTDRWNVEAFIDKTRRAMMGNENDLQLSSDDDVLRGALASGARAEKVHGLAGVERAISEGKLVVLAGNPAAYAHRFGNSQLTAFNGGHFVTVTHMVGDRVWINDPPSHVGSLEITRDELRRYMGYENWNVGVAVWA